MRRGGAVAIGVVAGWYALALALLHPLADGPVADSWIYEESVRWFRATGEMRFPGFTETMPVAQVLYGAAWGAIFGTSAASLDLASAFLGIVTALMLYALAMRCGARTWQALAAAGLLICNPCFLFLSFSFMSEIAFLAALLGSQLAFANAEGEHQMRWLWLSASLAVAAFAVRPFGGIAILGPVAAILIYDVMRSDRARFDLARVCSMLMPFAIALVGCTLIWWWLTISRRPPWKLLQREANFSQIFNVPAWEYLRMGVLGPLLYLGIVLSPLALLQVAFKATIRTLALAAGIFVATMILVHIGIQYPSMPEMSCFGGWSNALVLRGLSERFEWHSAWRYVMALLGSIGAAGLIFATIDVIPRLTRASMAVLIAAAVYWVAMLPLWFFNDRYFLLMVPAGALILAMAPIPEKLPAQIAVFAMTVAMGLMSLGGTYAYQRGLTAVMAARDVLEKRGIPRSAIDAGYELNGLELYPFPRETDADDSGVPMITSSKVSDYTIAARPFA
ncbi:MAG TPA: glycosyltransferase family 39 protein, partial [Candidatus Binataceae bacterium]|nr:glycosyltransferase family 39 protein [Candidatus Binataceae bacterium]